MVRRSLSVSGAIFLFATAMALAHGPSPESSAKMSTAIPAATRSQGDCSGFITSDHVPNTIYVVDGADNDLYEPLREFTPGDFVYLRNRHHESFTVGTEYSLVRPEIGFGLRISWTPGQLERQIQPPGSWYSGQRWNIRSLGQPYGDVGQLKVVAVTPYGAVAQVTFACGPINPGDIAVPYHAREIPEYTPPTHFDRFARRNGKMEGAIVAANNAAAFLAKGSIAYLNLGERDGARAGQHYRIFAIFRDHLIEGWEGILRFPETPRESVGELVILSTQKKSSVGIVVASTREISVGDGVELE